MGHPLGYARVSTTDQHPQLQVDGLQHAGCYRVFTETASGARPDRPTLEQVLESEPVPDPGPDPEPPAEPPTEAVAVLDADEDHDGLTRAGSFDPAQYARQQPGIPGQPPAPSITARPVARLDFSSGESVDVDLDPPNASGGASDAEQAHPRPEGSIEPAPPEVTKVLALQCSQAEGSPPDSGPFDSARRLEEGVPGSGSNSPSSG